MALFEPHRALGLVNAPHGVPFAVKRRGAESFVTVPGEDSFCVYDARKLTLVFRSERVCAGERICALATRKDWTFVGVGRDVACARRLRVECTLRGGAAVAAAAALFAFGHHLVVIDARGEIRVWDVDDDVMAMRTRRAGGISGGTAREEDSDSDSASSSSDGSSLEARTLETPRWFEATTVCHPDGYVDLLLFGAADGRMALVDVRLGTLKREYAGYGSRVTALENSPATDFVAVGLEDGRVLLVNLLDDTVLFTLTPEKGLKITALAFRTDDQDDILCVGDESGRVTVWDLEKRALRTMIVQCHEGPVVELKFLDGQPVMLSSGCDNSIKEWIFDREDGDARLLRFRAGHSKPPTCVSFYGEGKKLLAAGEDRTLRVFHTLRDQQNVELSQRKVSKRAKRIGVNEEELKLPPVTKIAWGELRERDWANIVTAHEGMNKAYTWRISKGAIGEHILQCPKEDGKYEVKSVCISACGNFAFVGAANGAVHRFNLQSGAHRGALERVVDADQSLPKKKKNGNEGYNFPGGKRSFWALANQVGGNADGKLRITAHDGQVTCIQAHCANRNLVTAGVDGFIRVWKFSELKVDLEADVGCPVLCGHLHEDSLFAVGCADKNVRVYDTITGKRVRTYTPRGDSSDVGDVKDVQISQDGRWVLALDTTGAVRVYDIPAARLVQHMILGTNKVVGMSFSPNMDYLVTVHENQVGLYLWVNAPLYKFNAKVAYGRKVSIAQPKEQAQSGENDDDVQHNGGARGNFNESEDVYVHPLGEEEAREEHSIAELETIFREMATSKKQVEPGLITMSNIPHTQIEMLLNFETVKERQKVRKEEKAPERVPFFLPTAAASDDVRRSVFDVSRETELNPTSTANDEGGDKPTSAKSRILRRGEDLAGAGESSLLSLIHKGERAGDYTEALEFLRAATVATVDGELRSLGPWDHKFMSQDDVKTLRSAIKFFTATIRSGLYYEMVNAHLSVFLDAHTTAIMQSAELVEECHKLRAALHATYSRIDDLFNEVQCSLSYAAGNFGT